MDENQTLLFQDPQDKVKEPYALGHYCFGNKHGVVYEISRSEQIGTIPSASTHYKVIIEEDGIELLLHPLDDKFVDSLGNRWIKCPEGIDDQNKNE